MTAVTRSLPHFLQGATVTLKSGSLMIRCVVRSSLCAAAVWLLPAVAIAQSPTVSLSGGISGYRLAANSGSAPVAAVRADFSVAPLVGEIGITMFAPRSNNERRLDVIPELQAQWQFSPILVSPYIGVGGGWVQSISGPADQNTGTVSAALGARFILPFTSLGFRGELRGRMIGSSIAHNAVELTLGVSW